jgi:glycosyltransferase involved in cell wall biosynthesis
MPGDWIMQTVDVLLATYNGARFLSELLRSIEAQTHPDWRLIVRDDGSNDDTPAILAEFAHRHADRVRLVRDGRRRLGACGNFAALLEASEAPYFMFCDQDDVWLPEKIAALLHSLQQLETRRGSQTPLLVHSDLVLVDDALCILHQSYWRYARLLYPSARRSPARLMLRNYVTGCALIANAALRRAALPIPPEARMHDWWVALVAAVLGEVAEHRTPTVLYRQHQKNELGAQSRHPLALLRQFLRAPLAIAKTVRNDIRRAQLQAAACERACRQSMPTDILRAVAEFSELPHRNFWRRKLFLPRYRMWPDYWLSAAICWWFL